MNEDKSTPIARLLGRAGSAHGVYEETVLNGVYDEAWHVWYAEWALENGFNDLVARPVDAGQLSRLLFDLNAEHRRAGGRQPWPAFYAERLAERLGPSPPDEGV